MTKKTPRVSTSFSLDQTILLDEMLSIMLRGGDPKMLRRNKAFGPLCQTAKSLRRRAENPTAPREKLAEVAQAAHDADPMSTLHPTHVAELVEASAEAAVSQ